MILYSFKRCPFAIRARSVLIACGVQYEHREVNLKDKPKSLLEFSPKGTVPVLVLDNKQIIDESIDIIKWAIGENDPLALARPNSADVIIDDTMSNFLPGIYQCKYPERYDVDHEEIKQKNRLWLQSKDKILSKQKYLFDDSISYVDFAVFPFFRQWRHIDQEFFESLNATNTWLESILAQDFFDKVMQNHPVWQD